MARRAWLVVAIALAGCGNRDSAAPPPPPGSPAPPGPGSAPGATAAAGAPDRAGPDGPSARCELLPFAESTPVPEASGAAWMALDGNPAPMLVVVSDSGNRGAYGVVDPETGATVETGRLPLPAEVTDDLEGAAARGERLYAITSAGWILDWRRDGKAFVLAEPAYPLGPVDLPDARGARRPPPGDGMVCNGRTINCGRDYEGLCLAPPAALAGAPPTACVGFAAAKADGHLYCLTDDAGKLVVHHDRAIAITKPGALADCAFGDDGALWAGSNLFDLSRAYRIARWQDPAAATVESVGPLPIGFPETLAVRGDIVYRMSDMGAAPSLMARFRCKR